MALYRRDRSPFWWMCLSVQGRATERRSTQIPIKAPSANQRAELKRQAEAVYAKAQAELVLRTRGVGPKPTRTLADHLTWYEKHVTATKRGAPREREILARLRAAFGSTVTLQDVTRERVIEWRTARLKDVEASTVDRELDVLKHALTQAVPTYLEASPIANLKRLPKLRRHETVVLSRTDEAKLLAALAPADQVIVIMALDTLMRAGDLLRLEWAHDHGKFLTVITPKPGASYRVPVSARLRSALKSLRRRGRFVFWHRRHGETERTRSNSLKQMLEDGCRRSKVKYGRGRGITFHGLRHTGATRLIEAGVDLRTVQEIGGWSSLRMLSRYLHPTDARKQEAVNTIGTGVAFTPPSPKKKTRKKARESGRKAA